MFSQIRARMLALSVLKQHTFLLELLICNHEIRQID